MIKTALMSLYSIDTTIPYVTILLLIQQSITLLYSYNTERHYATILLDTATLCYYTTIDSASN